MSQPENDQTVMPIFTIYRKAGKPIEIEALS